MIATLAWALTWWSLATAVEAGDDGRGAIASGVCVHDSAARRSMAAQSSPAPGSPQPGPVPTTPPAPTTPAPTPAPAPTTPSPAPTTPSPATPRSAALAALATASPLDVRSSVLIGPSGEVYEPDRPGQWIRRVPGGVAADVTGAVLSGDMLHVTGRATPFYRRRAGIWQAVRIGQRGKTVLGRGPAPAIAVGNHVFLLAKTGWARVAQVPQPITALWAAADRRIFALADGAVWALRGGAFVRLPQPVDPVALLGDQPWALTAGAIHDLQRGRTIIPSTPGTVIAAAVHQGTVWFLVAPATASMPIVLERHEPGAAGGSVPPVTTPTPLAPGIDVAALEVDRAGRALIITRGGEIHLWSDGAWSRGALFDALPPPHSGPGPARSR